MLGGVGGHFSQIGENAGGQKVGADKMGGAVVGALLVVAADVAILLAVIVKGGDSILGCCSLDYPPAENGGAVNGGAYAPFILTVDWLGWLCYF